MRSTLTYRGQLLVMRAKHRELVDAYRGQLFGLRSDGSTGPVNCDLDRYVKHRQCVALIDQQLAALPPSPSRQTGAG